MFDSHLHTCFSRDSVMTPEEACEKAISLNLKGIAVTDHLDYDYPGPGYEDDWTIDFSEYMDTLEHMKDRYGSRLEIIKGIEIGLQPHVLDKTLAQVNSHKFDFVIGSVHIIGRQDPYAGAFYMNKTKKAAYERYLQEILDMIRLFPNFDVLGHIDYIARYPQYDDRTLYYHDHADLVDEIFKIIIARGQGIEINTRTYYFSNNHGGCSLDTEIISRYKELGGEIITFGSDAHSANVIGYDFKHYADIICGLGFKYMAYYKERTPVFISLR